MWYTICIYHGLNTSLELSSFSSPHDVLSDKRPDLATTNWPAGNSFKVTDLVVTSPVSHSYQYSSTPSSLDHQRLLKKRESQKTSKYRTLAHSQGGDFEPLAVGTSGSITTPAKKLLQVVCSSQDSTSPKRHSCACGCWVAKTSLSLHKSAASEVTARSARASGRHYSGSLASSFFPDSADTHFEVSG